MENKNTKPIDLVNLKNKEILKEFEMVELKGGNHASSTSTNYSCTNTNCNKKCSSKKIITDM